VLFDLTCESQSADVDGGRRPQWEHGPEPEGDQLLAVRDLIQHTRNHLIEDINRVERSDTKYHESDPKYHVS
jgi:hypothetical protein